MENNQEFIISGTNDKLWNLTKFVQYLATNQNTHIVLSVNPEAICLDTLGVYKLLDNFKFNQVDIYTENQLEKHDKYNIVVNTANRFLAHVPNIDPELHNWNQKKTFLVFFHRPTASRLGIASYLFNNYKELSHIHFNAENDDDALQLYEFDKLIQLRKESLTEVANIFPHLPLTAYSNATVERIMCWYDYDAGIEMYQDVFVDIVGETHVVGNTFYSTEKTIRPMWLKKPFIIFAAKNHLDYLHQMGFKTFCNFWSEDYDGYEGRDRLLRIIDLIDSLAAKSVSELNDIYCGMHDILDHNYNLLLTQSYNKKITPIL
jgi:hypothetical protein